MNRTTFLLVAELLAAFTLPPELLAQSTNVRPRNINQNTRGKSGIFKGSGNLIQSNATASFIGGGQSNVITLNGTNAVIAVSQGNRCHITTGFKRSLQQRAERRGLLHGHGLGLDRERFLDLREKLSENRAHPQSCPRNQLAGR